MPLEDWIQHSKVNQFLYDWQTLIAGILAIFAAAGTIWATIRSAGREIKASQAQTAVAQKQIETTVRLERRRAASEASAFHATLAAAMARILAEADWAKKTYPGILTQKGGKSGEALVVRQCITKGAFAELRAACVQRGGSLTGEFLDLEREIDSFASQCEDTLSPTHGMMIREGKHAGLGEQLALIETKARALRIKALERI
jgi:hypothetical protein